jgi:hypothetical protein
MAALAQLIVHLEELSIIPLELVLLLWILQTEPNPHSRVKLANVADTVNPVRIVRCPVCLKHAEATVSYCDVELVWVVLHERAM